MMRRMIKTGLAGLLATPGPGRSVRARLSGSSPLILGYHRVVDDMAPHVPDAMPSMLTSTASLSRQLDIIGQDHDFVDLDEAARQMLEGPRHARRPVATVTFDDGYADVFENAFPLLRRKGIPFAVFVVTDLVGTGAPQLHDRVYLHMVRIFDSWPRPLPALARLVEAECSDPLPTLNALSRPGTGPLQSSRALLTTMPRTELVRIAEQLASLDDAPEMPPGLRSMTWPMLEALLRAGVTIGSHTRSHAFLGNETRNTIDDEVGASRRTLERRLGTPIRHFAYPDGDYHPGVVDAVADAGYRYAYTICDCPPPREPRLSIPRRMLWDRSGQDVFGRLSPAVLACDARGTLDGLSPSCTRDHR